MSDTYDVVVIGAGMSGLVDAILLAETGRRVLVLEQHTIPGGYLQQFRRKKTTFDVGFHYMGSTEPGRPMRQMLEHLRVWSRIDCVPFPADAAIEVRRGDCAFAFPATWQAFVDKAHATWPGEHHALAQLVADVERVCGAYKWFALRKGREYAHPMELGLSGASLQDYLEPLTDDPWLREVLGFQSFNLGLFPHEVPWVKHTLAFRSNFDTTSRVRGGGGALTDALRARGTELGVEFRFDQLVDRLDCADRRVVEVHTAAGERFAADTFVAACHPKPILRAISDQHVRPLFKDRILEMRESRGAVQLFARLREPLRSLGATCVMLRDPAQEHGDPPLSTVLVTCPSAIEGEGSGDARIEAMTYMHIDPFVRWIDRPVLKRGAEYEAFKQRLVERMLDLIATHAPELRSCIDQVYSSTPLTDLWYTRNEQGGVFGISHDVSQQGSERPMIRLRLKNLFFTGHSITMPGICGTFINAFDSCDAIRGDGVLFDAVAV